MDSLPDDATASMQRDVLAGRPSAPVHDFIHRALLPLELRARGEVRFPGE